MCVGLRTGTNCDIGIIQKSFKIHGIRVISKWFGDDISAMRCVFGEEVLARDSWKNALKSQVFLC